MQTTSLEVENVQRVEPACPVFGICGGCAYQDLPYASELQLKEQKLHRILGEAVGVEEEIFEPIAASPQPYHYRQRLDINLKRSKDGLLFGFQSPNTRKMVSIEACAIARKEVSDFLPRLREEASAKLPPKYRTANLVVRTGDDGRVFWGGIGRHSLVMEEKNYFWTEIEGNKIFYSLETFFQANLSILPLVIKKIRELVSLNMETVFLDLYAGVGLFGLCFAAETAKVIMVEDCAGSIKLAHHNIRSRGLKNVEIRSRRMEEELEVLSRQEAPMIAMVDPPRRGLSPVAAEALSEARYLKSLLYLSCHPESLARDLKLFLQKGWKLRKVVPFDFFPKADHVETLVLLTP